MEGTEAFALNNREVDGPALQSSFPDKHTPAGGLHLPGRGGVGRLKLNFQACIHSQHPHGNKLVRGSSARPPGATQLRPPRRAVLMGYPALLPYPSSQASQATATPSNQFPGVQSPGDKGSLPLAHTDTRVCRRTYTHTPPSGSHTYTCPSLSHTYTLLSHAYTSLCLTSLSPPTQRDRSTFKGKKEQAFAPTLGHTHSHTDVLTSHMTWQVSAARPAPPPHTEEGKVQCGNLPARGGSGSALGYNHTSSASPALPPGNREVAL